MYTVGRREKHPKGKRAFGWNDRKISGGDMKKQSAGNKKRFPWKQSLVLLLGIAVLGGFILFDSDVQQIGEVLRGMAPVWILAALGCMLIYYLGDAGMYLIACKDMGIPQRFWDGILTTMLGFFYSAITPLASGGQPFHIIEMRERGIKVGTATSVLMAKFLAWHIALTCLGVLAFILRGPMLMAESVTMTVMFFIGFLSHAFCAGTGLLLMIRPAFVERAGHAVIGWAGRVFAKKRPDRVEKWHVGWQRFVEDYTQAIVFVRAHKLGMLCILLVAFAEIIGYLSVTYCVYRGMGFAEQGYSTLLFMNVMLTISVAFIPLPGASGASEGGFYALFSVFFGGKRLVGMLLWRVMTYYLTMLLGLAAVIICGFRKSPVKPETTEAE